MNIAIKEQIVEDIRGRLSESPLVILTDFKGSTVKEMDGLRRACESSGTTVQVVKNTLSRRAVDGTELSVLTEHFKGNIALLISGEDPVATAKVFKAQAKANKHLVVRAGYFEGDVIDEQGVALVADLPSKEELLVTLLRTLQAGPKQVMGVIKAPGRDLVYLLNNYANKLEEQG